MRGLAEFVMKGRKQALMAAFFTAALPLVSLLTPIIVGLVWLRRGAREGAMVLGWAMVPTLAWAIYPVLAFDTIGNLLPLIVLLSVAGLAAVLRVSQSWQFTVLLAVLVGVVCDLYLRLQPMMVDLLMLQIEQLQAMSPTLELVTREDLITWLSVVYMVTAILSLMASRWLQAMLYQPGGFRREFVALRIESKVAVPLLVLLLLSGFGVVLPTTWELYFSLPFILAGTALVHSTIAVKQMSGLWLLVFYTVYPVILRFLVLFALIDSWYDFRSRMSAPPSGGGSSH